MKKRPPMVIITTRVRKRKRASIENKKLFYAVAHIIKAIMDAMTVTKNRTVCLFGVV